MGRIELPVPFLIPIFRLGIWRFAVRPSLALLAFMLVATGCIGPIGEGPLRAIEMGPFLDRPARLTVAHLIADVDGGTLAAVVINFKDQNLRADSFSMNFEPTVTGTLQDILAGVSERYKFDLFEVRGRDRKLLGYLLARQYRLVGHYFENNGILILDGAFPRAPGD
jgi:hypothetical protein